LAGKAALGLVGLGVVGHMLRSRRFHERVIVGAIVLGRCEGWDRRTGPARSSAWLPGINGRSRSSSAKLNGRPGALSAKLGALSAKLNGRPDALLSGQS